LQAIFTERLKFKEINFKRSKLGQYLKYNAIIDFPNTVTIVIAINTVGMSDIDKTK
jgi:hypothetical protein